MSQTPSGTALQNSVLLHAQAQELRQRGKLQAAAQAFQAAIRACPTNSAPYHALAEMLFDFGDVATATQVITATPAAVYRQSLLLQGLHARVLMRQGENAKARQLLEALATVPGVDHSRVFFNLGCCLNDLGDYAQAAAYFRKAAAAGLVEPLLDINLGSMLQKLGHDAEAQAHYDEALRRHPRNSDLLYEQATCLLRLEEYARAFPLLRQRWQSSLNALQKPALPIPEWDGQSPVQKLLVVREQGIGDQLVYAALLPGLMERVGQVTAALDPRLHALLQRTFPGLAVTAADGAMLQEECRKHDAYVFAADVGAHTLDNVGWRRGPLQPDPERVRQLRTSLRSRYPGKKLVGISWCSPKARLDTHKSIPIELWGPVLASPGCQFINLQYGDATADLQLARERFGIDIHTEPGIDTFSDIDGLVALIAALDQVITISNTTAHLAAAQGKPTWVLLSRAMGLFWYWGRRESGTAWYPAARLFRAQAEGQWDAVIAAVATALEKAE